MISRTSEGWKFLSEAALEKFVCENLKILFSADLLKQQYNCNGEISDILAVDRNPSFDFQLEDIDRASAPQGGRASPPRICTIPYQPIEELAVENLPEPPDLLIKWLGAFTPEEQAGFMLVRNKILGCHQKIKEEVIDKRYIQYGSGKTRLCAEIYFHSKLQKPVLFLWLPLPSAGNRNMQKEKPVIGRIRIWTDGKEISHIGHVPEGFGKMKTPEEWEAIPIEKRPSNWADWSYTSKSPVALQIGGYPHYSGDIENQDYWNLLSTLAVEKWVEKR